MTYLSSLFIGLAWLLFVATHLYMSGSNLRARLSPRVSKTQFTLLFTLVTLVTIGVLLGAGATYGAQGVAGPNLGRFPIIRAVLSVVAFLGVTLSVAGLINYRNSPMAVLGARALGKDNSPPLGAPTIVERVSRHPFFAGIGIFMTAHALMATTLASAVHFAGYVLFVIVGIRLLDAKLRLRWEEVYATFEAQTSAVPFTRGAQQRPKIEPKEWAIWAAAFFVTAVLVFGLHSFWAMWNGATFLAFDALFGTLGVALAVLARKAARKKKSRT